METVVKIHTTATSVHFLNEEGKAVVKLRVGDAYYVNEDKMYICKKKYAKLCGYERHFSLDEPVALFNVDLEEFKKVEDNRHLSLVKTDCTCFTDEYNWYTASCDKLCFD